MVCVVVEGGPSLVSTVLDYVSNAPPVPVFVFEGSGGAADLIAFLHKQTSIDRCACPLLHLQQQVFMDPSPPCEPNV